MTNPTPISPQEIYARQYRSNPQLALRLLGTVGAPGRSGDQGSLCWGKARSQANPAKKRSRKAKQKARRKQR